MDNTRDFYSFDLGSIPSKPAKLLENDLNRITENVKVDDNGCWIWQRSTNSTGYGQLNVDGKYWTAHRYSYFVTKGEIDSKLVIRHSCHNKRCCNPEHLSIGSHQDNYDDSRRIHREASRKRASTWYINGIGYSGLTEASEKTGIHHATILKYSKNCVFDIQKYRDGCVIARRVPKV